MTLTDAIEGTIEVTKGLNDIKASKLAFAKEALQITAQVGEAITPFIPLIGLAATTITEIIDMYQTAQYNKRICNSLLDRARLSEIAIDHLIRRRKENEKNFKSQIWYNAFDRFVRTLSKIKTFGENISQLRGITVYIKSKNIEEKFIKIMNEYDAVMKDLNFTMAIANEQQRQIDHEGLKYDLIEIQEFIKKINANVEENNAKIGLIYEEVQSIKLMMKKSEISEAKKIDGNKIVDPPVGREGDARGTKGKIKRKMYMDGIEVACKPIKIPEKGSGEYKPIQRSLAIYMKATQSPNIIQFHGLSTVNGIVVMVLEWAELGSLAELYTAKSKIPLELKLNYALDICRGIAYLNALDIYHHDLRCKNVMVTANHVAKLTNFDFSRGKHDSTTSIASRIEGGRWIAPEKLKEDQEYRYDQKCEIFSFGMLLWELVFERKPYESIELEKIADFVIGGGREAIIFNQSDLAPPSPSDTAIQKGFEKIIKQAWHQDPNIRISISRLLIDLDDLNSKSVKPGCSPGLQPQEIADKSEEIPEDESIDFSSIEIEPIIPINEGVKAHKEKNYEKAWKCFNEQAENQNSIGKYWKAYYLWEGFNNQTVNKKAALSLYKEAADDGYVDAQYRYACALLDRDLKSTVKPNPKEAVKYLQMAADNGSGSAQFQVGEAYSKGKLGFNKNLEVAEVWYKRAALRNDKNAIEKLKTLKADD